MKLVMLLDSSTASFEGMLDAVRHKEPVVVDTQNCSEINEYQDLLQSIEHFSQSNKEVMLAHFSGRESVIRELGDERSEMILTLSDKESSKYYTECPINVFRDLVQIFE